MTFLFARSSIFTVGAESEGVWNFWFTRRQTKNSAVLAMNCIGLSFTYKVHSMDKNALCFVFKFQRINKLFIPTAFEKFRIWSSQLIYADVCYFVQTCVVAH